MNEQKRTTVSVVIPAYNEENNITHCVRDLLVQETSSLELEKIYVYSDGSTDNTVSCVKKITDNRVECIEGNERKGVAHATNILFEKCSSDILIFLNADIAVRDQNFLEHITRPIIESGADLVSCPLVPLPPTGFFESVLYTGFLYKNAVFESWQDGKNVYTCHGPVRAFSRALYMRIRFHQSVADDMYSYLYACAGGFEYSFVSDTQVFFRLPSTFADNARQSTRFFKSPAILNTEFDRNLIASATAIPTMQLMRHFIKYFIKNPLRMSVYFFVVCFNKGYSLMRPLFSQTAVWEIAESSKKVGRWDRGAPLRRYPFIAVRRFFYTAFRFVKSAREKENTIVVFCYHAVADDSWLYSINKETVMRQIDYVLKTRKPITLHDIEMHIAGTRIIAEPSFAVTFDDGYKDVLSLRDFFKSRGIKPALFVLAHPEYANRYELESARQFLSQEDICEAQADGWEIGCHSATHEDFFRLGEKARIREITQAKKDLEANIGMPVKYFAYPKGSYSENVLKEVERAGYSLAFTVQDGFIDQHTGIYTVPRIGVDRSHALYEFKGMYTARAILFRKRVRGEMI